MSRTGKFTFALGTLLAGVCIGLSFAGTKENPATISERDSLAFEVKNLQEQILAERAKPAKVITETIRVADGAEVERLTQELAALKQAFVKAEYQEHMEQKKSECQPMSSVVPYPVYERRGIFRGRFRR